LFNRGRTGQNIAVANQPGNADICRTYCSFHSKRRGDMTSPAEVPPPEYPLSLSRIASYRDRGHILLRSVASPDEVDRVLPAIDRILDEMAAKGDVQGRIDDYSSLFRQITNVWRLSVEARAFVCAERFARIAAELMGVEGVRLYHDQALYKPAGGKPTPWHQDQLYWPLETEHTITMWMPLVDLTRDMGTMRFATGSHREGSLSDTSISEESDRVFQRLVSQRHWEIVSDDLQRGDATFHAGWTVHSAHPNTSARVRKVLTVIYVEDGVRIAQPANKFRQADLEVFLPGCRPGDIAASPLNPLLFPR
jgi:ectoine hydroxylase-related dioxygenase (phytanoyl-CoA dioxygenase family)